MICPNCKTEVRDGIDFCPQCGNRISREQELSISDFSVNKPKRKLKIGKIVITILTVIAVILAIGISTLFLYGDKILNVKIITQSESLNVDRTAFCVSSRNIDKTQKSLFSLTYGIYNAQIAKGDII